MVNPFEVISAQLSDIDARLQKLDSLLSNSRTGTRRTDEQGEAPAYVSKREAARLLSCSQSTIDNYARAGRLKRHFIGKGKAVRFDRVQVFGLAIDGDSTL